MIKTSITMLKAEEGYVLRKDDLYTKSVLLREGETEEGWEEITEDKYNKIMEEMKEQDSSIIV